MAEHYIAEQAIADYQQQQIDRGDAVYDSNYEVFVETSHRPAIRRTKGYMPEASFQDAVGDITAEKEATARAWAAYQEMQQQGLEVANKDDRFDPEYEYDLTGQGFQDEEPDFEAIDEYAEENYEDGESEDDDDYVDIWEDVVDGDPSTYPDPDDVVEQLQEVAEYFQPDPDEMRTFREIADNAEAQGDYEYACVARACQKAHAGVWSVQRAYQEVVNDIGIQEALRIWVNLEANGVISFN